MEIESPNELEIPEYLFHYTGISTLAMILESRKFKFNSLLNMDDIEEGMIADDLRFTKYCFVSSWTAEKQESISMW